MGCLLRFDEEQVVVRYFDGASYCLVLPENLIPNPAGKRNFPFPRLQPKDEPFVEYTDVVWNMHSQQLAQLLAEHVQYGFDDWVELATMELNHHRLPLELFENEFKKKKKRMQLCKTKFSQNLSTNF